ncbi:DUF4261 domain-containing protein [Xanthocytophaga agilis]|uniref:DUF4261 domain-containing protein n=1 Tax=Xanthocytophaga agilis TaxID=3048010 RepID=A0AAE3UDU5_9BACT|nr:DUF4261 domain-containing protein [Xanthocytophaga agilis]MDJ1500701.1 DUF4261 domain-containing protein [Xanthocytophaga agilis]
MHTDIGNQGQAQSAINEPELFYAQLLFEAPFTLDKDQILAELTKEFLQVDSIGSGDNVFLYAFPEYSAQYDDKEVPMQCAILTSEIPLPSKQFDSALQQNWEWQEAQEVIPRCQYHFTITDLLSRNLDYRLRAECFQKFVIAVIRVTQPQAVYFKHSDKLVEPFTYVDAVTDEQPDVLNGLMNIRFFNVSNGNEGELFMDTLGLYALGLPDFQITFTAYDPNEIASLLTGYGHYIYQKGLVIEEGSSIQGLQPDQIWICHFMDSFVPPRRVVITMEKEK